MFQNQVFLSILTLLIILGGAGAKTLGAIRIGPVGDIDTGELQFMEKDSAGSNYVGFKAPDSIGSNVVWKLPIADGNADQVLMTDGIANLSWRDVSSGNAMIPYEPWNQNIISTDLGNILNMVAGKVYFIQFIAPSTGYYTEATMLMGFDDINQGGHTCLGFAIYDNSGNFDNSGNGGSSAGTIDGENVHGVPGVRLGEARRAYIWPGPLHSNQYIKASFGAPPAGGPTQVHLVMDQLYWFAFAIEDNNPTPKVYGIYEDYDQSMNSIFKTVSNSDFTSSGFTQSQYTNQLTDLSASEHACWFRLSDPSSNFQVGPMGPTGPSDIPSSSGATAGSFLQTDGAGNLSWTDTWEDAGGHLRLNCRDISDVSGIHFCDGTYLGSGNSFDIKTNEVIHFILGGKTILEMNPNSGERANVIDFKESKLHIGGKSGAAGQVLRSIGSNNKIEWGDVGDGAKGATGTDGATGATGPDGEDGTTNVWYENYNVESISALEVIA